MNHTTSPVHRRSSDFRELNGGGTDGGSALAILSPSQEVPHDGIPPLHSRISKSKGKEQVLFRLSKRPCLYTGSFPGAEG